MKSSGSGASFWANSKYKSKRVDYQLDIHSPNDNFSDYSFDYNFVDSLAPKTKKSKNEKKSSSNQEAKEATNKFSLIQQHFLLLMENVRLQFFSNQQFNLGLKLSIYDEFCFHYPSNLKEEYDFESFWEETHQQFTKNEKCKKLLDLYFKKVCFIYFFKVGLISQLYGQTSNKNLNRDSLSRALLNPSSFFIEVFKKDSSTELRSKAFSPNLYSWYRPPEMLTETVLELTKELVNISLDDLLKFFFMHEFYLNKTELSEEEEKTNFSQLLKTTLINLSLWSENDEFQFKVKQPTTIINCKFACDNLINWYENFWKISSLPLSQNLIANFQHLNNGNYQDKFVNVCNDFFNFFWIIQKSRAEKKDVVNCLCSLYNKKEEAKKSYDLNQTSMFHEFSSEDQERFDRIIVNINQFPKNNPHFYLSSIINDEYRYLNKFGFLFIFSSKKLFVPSQNEKIHQILKELKFVGSISFDEVKSKIGIPPFIYIFKKLDKSFSDFKNLKDIKKEKHPCFGIRFRGDGVVDNNHLIETMTHALNEFMAEKSPITTSIFQKELGNDLLFEFYHDAIVDGRLINSTTKDSTKITHPIFFKNLMNYCISFDNLFQISSIDPEILINGKTLLNNNLPGLTIQKENDYDDILVVDLRQEDRPKVTFISTSELIHYIHELGMSQCFYFGLINKNVTPHSKSIEEFFSGVIGQQILQLFINEGPVKLKSKINSLLVPKFFADTNQTYHLLEKMDQEDLNFFKFTFTDLINNYPQDLIKMFNKAKIKASKIAVAYPKITIEYLSNFVQVLKEVISVFEDSKSNLSNFNNPVLIEKLLKTQSYSIYPKNPDYYLEFKAEQGHELHLPLTEIHQKFYEDGGVQHHYLQILSDKKVVLNIHSDFEAINFLKFILNAAYNTPISIILQNLKLPSVKDLLEILDNFRQLPKTIEQFHLEIKSLIEDIFRNNILIS